MKRLSSILILVLLAAVLVVSSGGGALTGLWAFVDGNGTSGINKNTTQNAVAPRLTVFGSKLYATWQENTNTPYTNAFQIRVAVYNGNDSSPSWIFVDGNGTSGINKNTTQNAVAPQLTVFGSKLYAAWQEDANTPASHVTQIRVAVYNGNDSSPSWAFVDGNGPNGINKDTTQSAVAPQLTVFGGKLYATWQENTNTPYTNAFQIRMAVYNGNDSSPSWPFVAGNGMNGINKNTTQSAITPQLTVFGNKLYATWEEDASTPAFHATQIRVAVYNGNDSSPSWTFVDGNGTSGINKNTTQSAVAPQLTVFGSKLYATWLEGNNNLAVYATQIRVAVYNSNDSSPSWIFVDGNGPNGINKDTTQSAVAPQLTVFGSKLYATWQENTNTPYTNASQIRVAVTKSDTVSR
jgi:predicted nucleic acid binding AN1-type Zn finger protein